jgi:hypothetical protein
LIYGQEIAKTTVEKVYQAAHEVISLNRTDQLLNASDPKDVTRSVS